MFKETWSHDAIQTKKYLYFFYIGPIYIFFGCVGTLSTCVTWWQRSPSCHTASRWSSAPSPWRPCRCLTSSATAVALSVRSTSATRGSSRPRRSTTGWSMLFFLFFSTSDDFLLLQIWKDTKHTHSLKGLVFMPACVRAWGGWVCLQQFVRARLRMSG